MSNIKTNLIYHVFPVKGNSIWLKNIEWLMKYSDNLRIFDRVIVSICIEHLTGEEYYKQLGKHYDLSFRDLKTHLDEDYIKSVFPEHKNIEFYFYENDPTIGEIYTFRDALKRVNSQNKNEITFYAHTKGTSYFDTSDTILTWTEMMYKYNLYYCEKIKEILKLYTCAGCFKTINYEHWDMRNDETKQFWPITQDLLLYTSWHYSGTFFWWNNEKVFEKNSWNNIAGVQRDINRHGVENYFGKFIKKIEGFELISHGYRNLYNNDSWDYILENEYDLINPLLRDD